MKSELKVYAIAATITVVLVGIFLLMRGPTPLPPAAETPELAPKPEQEAPAAKDEPPVSGGDEILVVNETAGAESAATLRMFIKARHDKDEDGVAALVMQDKVVIIKPGTKGTIVTASDEWFPGVRITSGAQIGKDWFVYAGDLKMTKSFEQRVKEMQH